MLLLAATIIIELAQIFNKQTLKGCEELWMTSIPVQQKKKYSSSAGTDSKFDWISMF